MDEVTLGMDPHEASVTIEARDCREVLRARGRFGTDNSNYRQLLKVAHQWPKRAWAVEGANGIGRPVAQRLLGDGGRVLDVPAKLAARARVFDTGQGRKTNASDAHAIVLVALRAKGLGEVSADPDLVVLRLLCDRRDELSHARAQGLNRLHKLFLELIPGRGPCEEVHDPVPSTAGWAPATRPGRCHPPPVGRRPGQRPAPPGRPAETLKGS